MNTTQCPECLSTNVGPIDPADDTVDCLACGVWWCATHPNSQPDHPLFGKPLLDGPPELLYCAICDENLRDSTPETPPVIIARWQDQWICTDCLDNRPGKDEAEAEAHGERQPMTQAEYRASGGGGCPRCHGGDLYSGDLLFESGIIGLKMTCLDCQLTYHEMYRLACYARPPETPEGQADDVYFHTTEVVAH